MPTSQEQSSLSPWPGLVTHAHTRMAMAGVRACVRACVQEMASVIAREYARMQNVRVVNFDDAAPASSLKK